MILLDLALQGVRDLKTAIRVRLQSGYNAVVCPQVRPDTLMLGLGELLYAEGFDPEADKLLATGGGKAGGGVTLMTPDGATYRVLRDLGAGTAQLFEFDRETRKFKEVSKDAVQISQFLRGRAGLCGRKAFEAAFVLKPADLPSQAGKADAATPEAPARDAPSVEARLRAIDKTLADHKAIEKLEFELDGLQKQRFEVEDKLKALAFDRSALNEAEAQMQRLRRLDVLPDDFLSRYEACHALRSRRDADLKRLTSEREQIERSLQTATVAPVVRDWRLWAGLSAGTLAIVAAALVGGLVRWLALADIPAFGLAAFVLYRSLSQREEREQGRRRLRMAGERQQKIMERDRKEIEAVEALAASAGLTAAEEVRTALKTRSEVRKTLAAEERAAEQVARDPRLKGLVEQRNMLGEQITALEERLTGMSAGQSDAAALRSEADGLRKELLAIEKARPVARVDKESKAPLATWLTAALDLLLTDAASAAKSLSERASLMVRPLSGNKLTQVLLAHDGSVRIQAAEGAPAAWAAMPPAVQDLAYLALRGALFLAIDAKLRMPLVCGELAAAMPGGIDASQTLLTTLAQAGQVVHLVRRPEEAPQAKHVVAADAGTP